MNVAQQRAFERLHRAQANLERAKQALTGNRTLDMGAYAAYGAICRAAESCEMDATIMADKPTRVLVARARTLDPRDRTQGRLLLNAANAALHRQLNRTAAVPVAVVTLRNGLRALVSWRGNGDGKVSSCQIPATP